MSHQIILFPSILLLDVFFCHRSAGLNVILFQEIIIIFFSSLKYGLLSNKCCPSQAPWHLFLFTYRCINTKCPYLLSYKKENKKNFKQKSKADVVCGCCGYSAIAVPCFAKKVWEFENSHVIVYYSDTHLKTKLHYLMPHSKLNRFLKIFQHLSPANFNMNV